MKRNGDKLKFAAKLWKLDEKKCVCYVAQLEALGMGRCREITQEAYDTYMAGLEA